MLLQVKLEGRIAPTHQINLFKNLPYYLYYLIYSINSFYCYVSLLL